MTQKIGVCHFFAVEKGGLPCLPDGVMAGVRIDF